METKLTIIAFLIGATLGSLFGWQAVVVTVLMVMLLLLVFFGYYILPENSKPNN